jgi:Condensation domain
MSPAPAPGRPSGQDLGFLMLQRLLPEVGLANLAWAFEFADGCRKDHFEACLRWLVRRHPALRTVFPAVGGSWGRRVLPPAEAPISVSEVGAAADRLTETIRDVAFRPVDITSQLPIRATLVCPADGSSTVLVLVVHHVAVDAIAAGTLLVELDACYQALAVGRELLPDEEHRPIARAMVHPREESLRYWREQLDGVDSRDTILRGHQREDEPRTFAARSDRFEASAEAAAGLRALRRRLSATSNIILLAGFYALLAAHGTGPDLVVGNLIRRQPEGAPSGVGYHVALLALRVRVVPAMSFRELVTAVGTCLFRGLEHCDASFEQVLPILRGQDVGWRVPIFRQVFNYLPYGAGFATGYGELTSARPVPIPKAITRYEFEFNVDESTTGLSFMVVHSTELFTADTIAALVGCYENILVTAARDPAVTLSELRGEGHGGRDR